MLRLHSVLIVVLVASVVGVFAGPVSAAIFYFRGTPDGLSNSVIDVKAAVSQITMEVTDASTTNQNQVQFTFRNSGPIAMGITEIYFADGTLLDMGLPFAVQGSPLFHEFTSNEINKAVNGKGLQGLQTVTPQFNTTHMFGINPIPSIAQNAVNPGEALGVIFTLQGTYNFNDTIAALTKGINSDMTEPVLRVGLHVQGFADGESVTLIDGCSAIPEPTIFIIWLLLGGIGLVFGCWRKLVA